MNNQSVVFVGDIAAAAVIITDFISCCITFLSPYIVKYNPVKRRMQIKNVNFSVSGADLLIRNTVYMVRVLDGKTKNCCWINSTNKKKKYIEIKD